MKVGVNGAVRDISDLKAGVSGAVRSVSEAYVGVNGAVKKVWPLYKVVVVDSINDSSDTYDTVDKFFEITDAEWSYVQQTSGWFDYYAIRGGPIYAYYVVSPQNSPPYSIQNGKFVLTSPRVSLISSDATLSINNGFAYDVYKLTDVKTIFAWIGFNTTGQNSFNFLYYINMSLNYSELACNLSICLGIDRNDLKPYIVTKQSHSGGTRYLTGSAYTVQKG